MYKKITYVEFRDAHTKKFLGGMPAVNGGSFIVGTNSGQFPLADRDVIVEIRRRNIYHCDECNQMKKKSGFHLPSCSEGEGIVTELQRFGV